MSSRWCLRAAMPSPLLISMWPAQNMSVGTFSSLSAPVVGFQTYALNVPASKTAELFPEPAISRILPPGPMIRWYALDPAGSDGRRPQLPPECPQALQVRCAVGFAALVSTGVSSLAFVLAFFLLDFASVPIRSLRIEELLLVALRLRFALSLASAAPAPPRKMTPAIKAVPRAPKRGVRKRTPDMYFPPRSSPAPTGRQHALPVQGIQPKNTDDVGRHARKVLTV